MSPARARQHLGSYGARSQLHQRVLPSMIPFVCFLHELNPYVLPSGSGLRSACRLAETSVRVQQPRSKVPRELQLGLLVHVKGERPCLTLNVRLEITVEGAA